MRIHALHAQMLLIGCCMQIQAHSLDLHAKMCMQIHAHSLDLDGKMCMQIHAHSLDLHAKMCAQIHAHSLDLDAKMYTALTGRKKKIERKKKHGFDSHAWLHSYGDSFALSVHTCHRRIHLAWHSARLLRSASPLHRRASPCLIRQMDRQFYGLSPWLRSARSGRSNRSPHRMASVHEKGSDHGEG
jgi:hypothetical protein